MIGSRSWLVVNSETLQPHPEALQFVLYLRGGSRSPNTIRAYTRAVATFLTWCERTGVPWRSASLAQLARFKTSLESTPTPTGRARSGRSVDLTLTAMCEFLRFAAASGLADSAVAAQLSERRYLAHVPRAFDVGENGQFRNIGSRVLRTRAAAAPPAMLTSEQVLAVLNGCSSALDRFIVRALHETGVRIGEFLGMRLEHPHLLPPAPRRRGRGPARSAGGLRGTRRSADLRGACPGWGPPPLRGLPHLPPRRSWVGWGPPLTPPLGHRQAPGIWEERRVIRDRSIGPAAGSASGGP